MTAPTFFATPVSFRVWLKKHHAGESELLVGFYKKGSGRPSLTWPESVDEALCVGWIDGVRRNLDPESYSIRFSPRKAKSIWSAVNIRRVQVLIEEGRMTAAGLAAFERRTESRSGIYAYEQRPQDLPEPYAKTFRQDATAWEFFMAQPPSYRTTLVWWVVSAKQDTTRESRLAKLIAESAAGRRMR